MGWGGSDMLGTAGPIQALLGPFEYNGGYLPTLAPEQRQSRRRCGYHCRFSAG